jgi:hypothetical protein
MSKGRREERYVCRSEKGDEDQGGMRGREYRGEEVPRVWRE